MDKKPIFLKLNTDSTNVQLEKNLKQGATNKELKVTLTDNNLPLLVDPDSKITISVFYNPRKEYDKFKYDGRYDLAPTDPNYDVTVSQEVVDGQNYSLISIPFKENFVSYAGKNRMVIGVADNAGVELYSYALEYITDLNEAYEPTSVPSNLPTFKELQKEIDDLKTEYSHLEGEVIANTGDISNKAEKDLSNVLDFSNVPENEILIKQSGEIKSSGISVSGNEISAPLKTINVNKIVTSPNTVEVGKNISLSENGGFLEMHTKSLGNNYILLEYKNDPANGTSVPAYWERDSSGQFVIQPDDASNMVLTQVNFGHPNFDRQLQSIFFNFITAVTNFRMEIEVNGQGLFYYPSKNAWDGLEPGLNLPMGVQEVPLRPFFTNLMDYEVIVNFRADNDIHARGNGTIPWYKVILNRMTKRNVALEDEIVTKAPSDGILYGMRNDVWTEIVYSEELPPTQNEVATIGAGRDYETLKDFLDAQRYRKKNNFTVTGEIMGGEVIDSSITYNGGDFTNVIITSELGIVDCTTANTPFTFMDCVTPTFNIHLNLTNPQSNPSIFSYTNCVAPIGSVAISSDGWGPSVIFDLKASDAFCVSSNIVINKCAEYVFKVISGELLLNHITINDNCKFLTSANGARIDSMLGFSFPATIDYNINTSGVLIETEKGSILSNVNIQNTGRNFEGTPLKAIGSWINNVGISADEVRIGIEAYHSILKEIEIDVDNFVYSAIEIEDSEINLNMLSPSNTGGNMKAVRSKIIVNKATTVDYTKGSYVYIESLATTHPGQNTITDDGILIVPTTTKRIATSQVIAGNLFNPIIALNLEFTHIKMHLNVKDMTNALMNSYNIEMINRPSGLEIVKLSDIGTPEHNFSSISDISAKIENQKVVLVLDTSGTGEQLEIDYDIYYSK